MKEIRARDHILWDNLKNATVQTDPYQYIEVDVDDLTETDVDLECYEAENLEAFKNRHGSIPVLNIREEKTTNVNKALTRKFFIEEEVSE